MAERIVGWIVTGPGSALITGATAGIGAAFARRLTGEGYRLILVARDDRRLSAAATALGGEITTLAADLATAEGRDAVADRLAAEPVDLLVNNAGIGLNRSFLTSSIADQERLLDLNVRAVQRLTHAVLPAMVERRRGAIVNVASVAGFGPVMPGSTYPASKAWVMLFSEAVAQSVRRYGVRVMALCPGYTQTEFHERAGIDMSRLPGWLWSTADDVVRIGMRDLRRRKVVSVPGWQYKMAVAGLRCTPRSVIRRLIG